MRSQQIWAVCSKFNVLPTDPRLRDLTPVQWLWVMSNMSREAAQQRESPTAKSISFDSDSGIDVGSLQALIAQGEKIQNG